MRKGWPQRTASGTTVPSNAGHPPGVPGAAALQTGWLHPGGGFPSTLVAHNSLEQVTELRAARFLRSQVRENKRMRLFLSS